MSNLSAERFDTIAQRYAASEVHASSPTLRRLRALLPDVSSLCDVACGAGHTGLFLANPGTRLVAVDPAPKMLEQTRLLAEKRGRSVETVVASAEAIPLPARSFDLVVSRLAAHHFTDVSRAVAEMARLTKPGGYVGVIDLEGDPDPVLDELNHRLEVLHDATHVRSYPVVRWRELFGIGGIAIEVCENRNREIPAGLAVQRWCEIGDSGPGVLSEIRRLLDAAGAEQRAALGIVERENDYHLPVRTLLILGRVPVSR